MIDIFKLFRLISCKLLDTHHKITKHDDCIGVGGHWSCDDCGLDVPAIEWPRMPECEPPKTDFNEMCESCFGSMISKMPLRTICDLKEVERQRVIGCSHNQKPYKGVDNSDLNELLAMATRALDDAHAKAKPTGPPNTKLNGDPL